MRQVTINDDNKVAISLAINEDSDNPLHLKYVMGVIATAVKAVGFNSDELDEIEEEGYENKD